MTLKTKICGLILGLMVIPAHSALKEGVDYTTLSQPIPQVSQNKIEVLEFFAYFCIHCKHLEPIMQKHVKTLPSDVTFRQEHIVWEPAGVNLARILSAVQTSKQTEIASPAIFKAVFDDRLNFTDPAVFQNWLSTQTSFDAQAVLAAYQNPASLKDAQRMEKMTLQYKVSSTPMVIVGGKYQLHMNDFENDMKRLDELIDKVRQEKSGKTASAKLTTSKGSLVAALANK